MDWEKFITAYFSEPVRVVNCNDCIHINITEEEQNVMTGRRVHGHMCNYYHCRVCHESNILKFNDRIYPCDKCFADKHVNFREKTSNFNPSDLVVEAEYITDADGIVIKNNRVWGQELGKE